MTTSVYMSEISPYWTFERQEAVLADVLPGARVFRDALIDRQRQGRPSAELIERGKLLREDPCDAADDALHVASLAVIAWSAPDLLQVTATLAQRGIKLVSAADGEWEDPLAAWHAARTKARLVGASLMGGEVLKRKMADEFAPKVEAIRDRWGNPAYDTADLLREANVSRNTAVKYLGMNRKQAVRRKADELDAGKPGTPTPQALIDRSVPCSRKVRERDDR